MIVYKAQNKINGKIYIGQTIGSLARRIISHKAARAGIFPSAIKKYGIQNFSFESIAWCDSKEHLDFLENFYINFLNSKIPNGYNITEGGNGGMLGYKASEETKRKQSKSSKGKNKGNRNGMFGKESWMKGRYHKKESNEKNREIHKRLWQDPIYRKKLSEAHKGKPQSKETREKRSKSMKTTLFRKRNCSHAPII
jgi:group I intron endonuclease